MNQACSMNNVHIVMPVSSRHTGITMNNGGSGTIIADCVSGFLSRISTDNTERLKLMVGRASKVALSVFNSTTNNTISNPLILTVAALGLTSHRSLLPPFRILRSPNVTMVSTLAHLPARYRLLTRPSALALQELMLTSPGVHKAPSL